MSHDQPTIANPIQRIWNSPLGIRVVPFVVFLLLTWLQGKFGEASRYWLYLAKTLVGAGMIWAVWPRISEMRWRWSRDAVLAGVGVFLLWISLDTLIQWCGITAAFHRLPGPVNAWNPFVQFGENSTIAWLMVVVRLIGVTWVVPPLEEVFYRSLVYRYLIRDHFESVPLDQFDARSFFFTSLVFSLTHGEWLAALLCGFVYQGLVIRKGRIGDAMVAHALTNLLLGMWVLGRGAWQFW
jgi:CAAX prenyl protease-like protein